MGTRDFWDSILHHRGELHRIEGRKAELWTLNSSFSISLRCFLPCHHSLLLTGSDLSLFSHSDQSVPDQDSLALAPQCPSHCRVRFLHCLQTCFLDGLSFQHRGPCLSTEQWSSPLSQRALPGSGPCLICGPLFQPSLSFSILGWTASHLGLLRSSLGLQV